MSTSVQALVLVDLQRWIVARPLAPRSGAEVVAACADLLAQARATGAPVVHLRFLRADGSDGGPTGEAAIVEELTPLAGEDVVDRGGIDGFAGTGLADRLATLGVTGVLLGGIATSYGVGETALGALQHGLQAQVVETATSCIDEAGHRSGLARLAAAGVDVLH